MHPFQTRFWIRESPVQRETLLPLLRYRKQRLRCRRSEMETVGKMGDTGIPQRFHQAKWRFHEIWRLTWGVPQLQFIPQTIKYHPKIGWSWCIWSLGHHLVPSGSNLSLAQRSLQASANKASNAIWSFQNAKLRQWLCGSGLSCMSWTSIQQLIIKEIKATVSDLELPLSGDKTHPRPNQGSILGAISTHRPSPSQYQLLHSDSDGYDWVWLKIGYPISRGNL